MKCLTDYKNAMRQQSRYGLLHKKVLGTRGRGQSEKETQSNSVLITLEISCVENYLDRLHYPTSNKDLFKYPGGSCFLNLLARWGLTMQS